MFTFLSACPFLFRFFSFCALFTWCLYPQVSLFSVCPHLLNQSFFSRSFLLPPVLSLGPPPGCSPLPFSVKRRIPCCSSPNSPAKHPGARLPFFFRASDLFYVDFPLCTPPLSFCVRRFGHLWDFLFVALKNFFFSECGSPPASALCR